MTNRYTNVVDNEQSNSRTKRTTISFPCSEGFSDPVNEAFGVANDALHFGTITGTLYEEKYNFRALPYAPRLVVHYGSCYDNAFWDGTDMYFGDGCRTFYPLVSQDVVTHELGHGITSRNSDLIYSGQSGGINEAFSDMSGEVAEIFGRGNNDWKVGFELFKGNRPLRYFIRPPDDGVSIMHVRDYTSRMDVHFSSGVFNHAFYQLVAIQNMPIYDAYECFVSANRLIWSQNTNFEAGACGVMQACHDLGFSHTKVAAAFDVVGIDLGSCDYSALSTAVSQGQARDNIRASATRNPIMKLQKNRSPLIVEANALDESDVHIDVCTDAGCEQVITSGSNRLSVSSTSGGTLYARLSSTSTDEVKINLSVS
ncbi:elastase-like [Aplysia californica]|uniref:Elastase-like n=1 Tax=Aplysia californica TaxID=6500 RepID=A0ABM0ZZU0_APLCA|nr:elastase-like [Aplysia californica]